MLLCSRQRKDVGGGFRWLGVVLPLEDKPSAKRLSEVSPDGVSGAGLRNKARSGLGTHALGRVLCKCFGSSQGVTGRIVFGRSFTMIRGCGPPRACQSAPSG